MAEADGWSHADLVNGILDAALRRLGLVEAITLEEERASHNGRKPG